VNLRNLHVGEYGAVMGLAGLGLTARSAAPLFPGVFRAPAYFTEPWVAAAVIACVVLVFCYAAKLVRTPQAVKEDFTNPGLLGFCGALPVGITLVAGGVGPYAPGFARAIWWIGCGMLVLFQVWALSRLFAGSMEFAKFNAGWLIILVGGIVVPGPGIALGEAEAARAFFGVSATVAPLLMALLLYRATALSPLPEGLRPTWFILLVPPSLIYANGSALYDGFAPLENLFYFDVVLALALFFYARGLLRWPFGPAWWAFTFPLDALAYAAVHFAQQHPSAVWRTVAGAALLLATLFVSVVLLRSLAAILRNASSRPA
jgi:tellurite resistance protein